MAFYPVTNPHGFNNPENFPLWALGPELQTVVGNVQYQTSAPSSAIATALMTAMSVVCQGKIRIKKRGNLISPVSLWNIVIQESGERKSTVIKLLLKSVMEFSSMTAIKHSNALEIYYAALDGWKSEGKGIQKKIRQKVVRGESVSEDQQALLLHAEQKPIKPKTLKLIHENATPSAIIRNLDECFPTTSLLSDEGHTVFNSRAMADLGLLNKAWDGGTIHVDRVIDGSLVIHDPCLTVGLFVQRDVLLNYFLKAGANSLDHLAYSHAATSSHHQLRPELAILPTRLRVLRKH